MGGGTQAGVRQQRSLVNVAEQSLRTVRRDVRVNTRSLFRTVNTNIESASALKQTIISRRSALDATRAGYEVGTRNIVEVLDAERNYYVALRDFANARYDYVINTLSLKQAAGTLSPQDLIELNRWLSASALGIEALAQEEATLDAPNQ
jgi:outer membrane protein